jgi:hypothetical protein
MSRRPLEAVILAVTVLTGALGCEAIIGDPCKTNYDCSEDGDRVCDRTQPHGYCTILDCEPNGCPTEAVCVQFFDGVHARNYCMRQCKNDGDCDRGLYECVEEVEGVSTILDNPGKYKGYCAPETD